MFKYMFLFAMLSVFLYLGVNFALLPFAARHFPSAGQYLSPLTFWSSAGVSGVISGFAMVIKIFAK